ncbi:MAG: hypothetical protein QHH19_04175 [Candidatus Thermoplasmatota archaeon]|nr:hypothetical protein [Candidatus Thermoplasmatota archaeon]
MKEIKMDSDIGKISSNGEKLACVYSGTTNTIIIIDIQTILNDTPDYIEVLSEPGIHFNLPQDVFIDGNHLFVADTNFNRVLIWNNIPSSGSDIPDIVIGQNSFECTLQPKFTKDGLFFPGGVWFDGNFLWVGEFKFSHRVLRYSIH